MKAQLQALVPGLRCFLDLDDLVDLADLESMIEASDAVIHFL